MFLQVSIIISQPENLGNSFKQELTFTFTPDVHMYIYVRQTQHDIYFWTLQNSQDWMSDTASSGNQRSP